MFQAMKQTTEKVTFLIAAIGLVSLSAGPAMAGDKEGPSKFEKDRQAILDMAGEYEVGFNFYETVAVQDGYEKKDAYQSGATELVKVVEDSGERIVLQRILVAGESDDPHVVKHWRQVWTYEPDRIYVFRGDRTWQPRELTDAQADGKWAEAVFQVDDSPRYAGLGQWTHQANVSAWQSGKTWRPLPRRERKRKDEYDVMVSRFRYTQTPAGWVQEQDSYKLVLEDGEPAEVLTREGGLNRYERTDEVDFAPARAYWQRTAPFWKQVRSAWRARFAEGEPIHLKYKVDGQKLWERMFERAGEIESRDAYDKQAGRKFIDRTLDEFLTDPS
jgi:hypothetical protein